ncbi:MAG: hypothetical protein EHM55_08915 [Acidobacteria bacterium]|nr:MAG: hypothetical protein EHM55_08915 [Acidobacteriota bacterium]
MTRRRRIPWPVRAPAALAGMAAATYAAYVGAAWLRYGHPHRPDADEADDLLDRFMPAYDVAERHHIGVAAPAAITFAASMDMDLEDSPIIRAIFKGREILLGADRDRKVPVRGLVAVTKALGWGVLAERPDREIVMGAVTQPWKANVEFRSLPPDEFAAFDRPGFVKIVWTLRADAVDANRSIARTETRVVATDGEARRRFRWYWARFSAGIVLIREVSMRLVKTEAERRATDQKRGQTPFSHVRDNDAWRPIVRSF